MKTFPNAFMNDYRQWIRPIRAACLLVGLSQLLGCADTALVNKPFAPLSTNTAAGHGNPQAVADALQLQGQPYVNGGESPIEGFDCSGLVFYVYNKQGLRLPRDTASLAKQLLPVKPEQRQPGDLLFFTMNSKPLSHVAIYVGQDRFVHAPSSRTGRVMTSDLNTPYWQQRFAAVRRPHLLRSLSFNDSVAEQCAVN